MFCFRYHVLPWELEWQGHVDSHIYILFKFYQIYKNLLFDYFLQQTTLFIDIGPLELEVMIFFYKKLLNTLQTYTPTHNFIDSLFTQKFCRNMRGSPQSWSRQCQIRRSERQTLLLCTQWDENSLVIGSCATSFKFIQRNKQYIQTICTFMGISKCQVLYR